MQPETHINIGLQDLYLDDIFPILPEQHTDLEQLMQERQRMDDELAELVEQQLAIISPNEGQQETQGQSISQPPISRTPTSRSRQLQKAAQGSRDIRSMFNRQPSPRSQQTASSPIRPLQRPSLGSATGVLGLLPSSPIAGIGSPAQSSAASSRAQSPAAGSRAQSLAARSRTQSLAARSRTQSPAARSRIQSQSPAARSRIQSQSPAARSRIQSQSPAARSRIQSQSPAAGVGLPLPTFLIQRLKRFPACQLIKHHETDSLTPAHLALHHKDGVSQTCGSLHTIANHLWSQPSRSNLGDNIDPEPRTLPNVLDSGRLGLAEYPPNLDCRTAFEGFDSRVPDTTPPRLCMSTQHSRTTQTTEPFFTSFDIDSICAFSDTLASCRQGIRWFGDMYTHLNITANVHLGLSVPPEVTSTDTRWRTVPLHTIPHYAFGQVSGWDTMIVHIFFPRLYKDAHRQSKPLELTLLSGDQYSLWVDAVVLPAIADACSVKDENGNLVPDANVLQHLPPSRQAAAYNTSAPTEHAARTSKQSTESTTSRRQMVTTLIGASTTQRLTDFIRKRIEDNPECQIFRDFVLYFNCKNTKLQFMASDNLDHSSPPSGALPRVGQQFLESWAKCLDDETLDPTRVFIDLGKQVTATPSALPYDSGSKPASTFLYRKCCLQAAVDDREEWLAQQIPQAEDHQASPTPPSPRAPQQNPAPPAPDATPRQTPAPPAPPAPEAVTLAEGEDQDANHQQQWEEQDIARGRSTFNNPKRRKLQDKHEIRKPQVTFYPWAITDEVGSITITSSPTGADLAGGLVYSQYYNLTKAPFDAQKVYALQPPVYENLAIDPLYLRQLRQAGRASITDQATLKKGYLLSKQRAALNLRESVNRSFGIREEHRISLSLFRQVLQNWDSITPSPDNEAEPLPWFSVPTTDVLHFLRGQINRHCLLFEYILGRTGPMFSLAETVPMVIALRGLRYCYSSNAIFKEPLLFGDKWTQREWVPPEVREQDLEGDDIHLPQGGENRDADFQERERIGLGLSRSMEQHGFGWWKSGLFQWEFWRFHTHITRKLLVGNLLLHAEYRKRWKAIRQVRNTQVQLFQAQSWFQDYNLQHRPQAQATWLDYLHCLVLRQFDLDVWQEMYSQNKRYEELIPTRTRDYPASNPPAFCWDKMFPLFFDRDIGDETPCGPHLVVGNKLKITDPEELIRTLFEWRDRAVRKGWSARNYRVATQRSFAMISHFLSNEAAEDWLDSLMKLVRLTRWILPYPNESSFFSFTKTHGAKNLNRRVMWFPSILYQFPEDGTWVSDIRLSQRPDLGNFTIISTSSKPEYPIFVQTTLEKAIGRISQDYRPNTNNRREPKWTTQQVVAWCVQIAKEGPEVWSVGKATYNSQGIPFIPMVEGGSVPELVNYQLIKRGKDFDELDTWFRDIVSQEESRE
jgi:hypothetical protein